MTEQLGGGMRYLLWEMPANSPQLLPEISGAPTTQNTLHTVLSDDIDDYDVLIIRGVVSDDYMVESEPVPVAVIGTRSSGITSLHGTIFAFVDVAITNREEGARAWRSGTRDMYWYAPGLGGENQHLTQVIGERLERP